MMDNINEMTPHELEELMKEDKNIVVIDVREDEEVAQGMIADARHIPLQDIPQSIDTLDKEKHYVMVCRSGRRSLNAAAYLNERGFRVSSMTGGMLNWDGEVIL
ncbi:rhodanese-like domain-containing protein [Virgibacillus dakarensis]